MNLPAYSIVIPTLELPEELDRTLDGIYRQTHAALMTIVVDSSADDRSRQVADLWARRMPVQYEHTQNRSAALQRNYGGRLIDPATSPIVAFVDDDILLESNTCERICNVFRNDQAQEVGGISARIKEIQRPRPSGLSWWYYRIQAGYSDETYGGRLFGCAINCLPCYDESEAELIPAEWLNSGCVFYRTLLFQRELFPAFSGYSFMEDVHLSARVAKTHRLYFHKSASCSHRDGAAARTQPNAIELARSRVRNQRTVANEVLSIGGPTLEAKLLLHRLFVSASILRRSGHTGWRELLGTWT